MVGIITAVCGQVEGDREAFLTGGEVAAVEGVGVFCRGEARILANRPGLVRIHGGVRPASERGKAWIIIQIVEPLAVTGGIGGFDGDAFRRFPGLAKVWRLGLCIRRAEIEFREVGEIGHWATPKFAWASFSVCSTSQPMKMLESMLSPSNLPASQTWSAPAAFSALAVSTASSS